MGFDGVEVGGGCGEGGPEEGVVVGKEGEEDAEEEGCCWWRIVSVRVPGEGPGERGWGREDLRTMIMKVAMEMVGILAGGGGVVIVAKGFGMG